MERASPKGTNEPQTLDPFIECLNFMFKYTNSYLLQKIVVFCKAWNNKQF